MNQEGECRRMGEQNGRKLSGSRTLSSWADSIIPRTTQPGVVDYVILHRVAMVPNYQYYYFLIATNVPVSTLFRPNHLVDSFGRKVT